MACWESSRSGACDSWYHWRLTYNRPDPDTEAVVRSRPQYVILHRYTGDHLIPIDRLRNDLDRMPVLEEFLTRHYTPCLSTRTFLVLESRP